MRPETLRSYLRWYGARWDEDIPSYGSPGFERTVAGGPIYTDGPLASFADRSPYATDEDGYYITPLRAAVASLGRKRPLMARFLVLLGRCGSWEDATASCGIPADHSADYTMAAIGEVYARYRRRPLMPVSLTR